MTMTPACRITLLRRCLRSKSTFVAASPKSFDPSNRPNATVHPQTKNLIDKGFNLPRSKMKVSNPPEEIIDTLQHLLQTGNDIVLKILKLYSTLCPFQNLLKSKRDWSLTYLLDRSYLNFMLIELCHSVEHLDQSPKSKLKNLAFKNVSIVDET